MTKVKNRLYQPLTFALSDGRSLHLQPRQVADLPDVELSEEMRQAAKRGFLHLTDEPAPAKAAPATKPQPRKRSQRR